MRDNFKPRFAFQQNRVQSWNKMLKNALIWMGSVSASHWWYLFHQQVKSWDSTIWLRIWQFQTSGLTAVSSNASPVSTVRFLGVMLGVFWMRESRLKWWHQRRLLTRQFYFCLHIYSLCLLHSDLVRYYDFPPFYFIFPLYLAIRSIRSLELESSRKCVRVALGD
jgi:hypothetical protein